MSSVLQHLRARSPAGDPDLLIAEGALGLVCTHRLDLSVGCADMSLQTPPSFSTHFHCIFNYSDYLHPLHVQNKFAIH